MSGFCESPSPTFIFLQSYGKHDMARLSRFRKQTNFGQIGDVALCVRLCELLRSCVPYNKEKA